MKGITLKRLISYLFLLTISVGSLSAQQKTVGNTIEGAKISSIIQEVKESLQEVQENAPTGFPFKLTKVSLDLEAGVTSSKGGGINLWVIKIGARKKEDIMNKLHIELAPPPEQSSVAKLESPSFKSLLSNTIYNAEKGLRDADRTEPKLQLKEMKVQIKFVVEKSAEGSLDKEFEVLPVSLEGKRLSKSVQNLELVFTRK